VKRINFEDFCVDLERKIDFQCEFYDGILGDQTITLKPDQLKPVIDVIFETFDYFHLSAITVQQREARQDEIEVFYNFWCGFGFSFMLKLSPESAKLPSIISIIPGADFYEREAAEMFGIEFTGRCETPALLLPDEWDQGPPFIGQKEKNG
jgi:NADH:ubiquinone oxidoreductase subunit C